MKTNIILSNCVLHSYQVQFNENNDLNNVNNKYRLVFDI